MRTRIGVLLFVTLCTTPMFAQMGELGLWVATSQVGETRDEDVLIDFDNARGFGISLNQYWGSFSGELAATALTQEGRLTAEDIDDIDIGDLDLIPITGTLQYHFAKGSRVSPYIGGGIAYILADDLQSDDLEFLDIGTVEIQDELTWALQAGLDFNFSERFGIGVDAKYIAYTPESASADDDEPIDLDLNPVIISAGVKFRW